MVCVLCVLLLSIWAVSAQVIRYDGYSVLRVTPHNEDQLQRLKNLLELSPQMDVWKGPSLVGVGVDIMMTPDEKETWMTGLSILGLDGRIMIEDVQSLIEETSQPRPPRNTRELDTDRYYNLNEIWDFLDDKVEQCGGLCEVITFGTSFDGRPLKVMRIGSTNPDIQDSIWTDHGIHAREWISPAVGMYFIERLIADYGVDNDVTVLRDNFNWYIDPTVNPDGYDYTWTDDRMWRKTRSDHNGEACRGVDGNRNFPEGWGGLGSSDIPCSQSYRGPSPMSEVEISSINDFMEPIASDFKLAYTVHSYGQFMVYPWGYTTDVDVDNDEDHDRLGQIHVDAINAVHNTGYISRRSNGDMAGNTIDWAKGPMGITYSYLMEVRDDGEYGFLLPPEQILPTDEEIWAGMKAMALAILEDETE